jgi:chromosome segregation ATPase
VFAHPAYLYQVSSEELDHLRSENAELRRRVETVRAEIDQLRAESLQRRDEVRQLVADLPAVVSRRAVVRQMFARASRRQMTSSQ